ncbi:SH3 domain-containing protein [Baaleninema simplex]|uniref:SH3 domain-containing protein n=1 Tax=Baaleninema simplex TaxID=2862350 RepID=UPI00034CD244|nr:SH3 domain-containing protein [Baaleninema simplex]
MKFPRFTSPAIALIFLFTLSSCTTSSDPSATVTPSPTTLPTATPDPTPTATPEPTPTATPEPTPTATPEPLSQAPASAPTPPPEPTPAPTPQPAAVRLVSCTTTMARVSDPGAPLNVRSAPEVAEGNIVGTLDNGTFVSVESDEGSWWKISDPVAGWIYKDLTESGCNQKVARVQFPVNATAITLGDRFIGTGTHQYYLEAAAGQTTTLTALEGPLPFFYSPNGTELTDAAGMRGESTWRGRLPESGDYTLEFPSNYKGYEYEVKVEIQ